MSASRLQPADSDLQDLVVRARGYTPDWHPTARTPGLALAQVFARYMDLLKTGLAQAPGRSFLAFLDMLGAELLPAQAARAPLVFTVMEDSPVDVTLPEHSQVAAISPPLPPSRTQAAAEQPRQGQPLLFSTEQTITLSRSKLAALYSIDPGRDQFADHTGRHAKAFTLFDDMLPTEHALYFGHDELFALTGDITVILAFSLASSEPREARAIDRGLQRQPVPCACGAQCDCNGTGYTRAEVPPTESLPTQGRGAASGLGLEWEYLTETGWLPLTSLPEDDTTGGLRHDGQFILKRECGPNAKEKSFAGRKSFWVRGRLTTPLPPREMSGDPLPVINDIRASVRFGKAELLPEAAFSEGIPLDPTKDFFPFGQFPVPYATFYVASKEVFQRKRAHVRIDAKLSQEGKPSTSPALALLWEYSTDTGWRRLELQVRGGAEDFTKDGSLSFLGPNDWAEVSVNGVKNFWLRARIDKGDYGQPLNGTPPVVSRLTLGYTYLTDPEPLHHCLGQNDFVFEDHTEACRWPDQTFVPFRPVADRQPAVHLGFTRALPAGLVSLLVAVPESAYEDTSGSEASPYVWEYRSVGGWNELGVLDETIGFRGSGLIQFVGPPDAVAVRGLGGDLFRLRARLKPGERTRSHPLAGLWINAVWAGHSVPIEEPLGSSDDHPGQTFRCQRAPVLSEEKVEVQEWTGRGDHWRTFVLGVPDGDLRFERDRATNEVTAVWVLWHRRKHLYDSGPFERHYTVEGARGLIRFGDGRKGLIPPVDRRVVLTYRSGGGLAGNVPAGAIHELHMAVPFVMGATNPMAAAGGSAVESLESIRSRGPQQLRHRSRAVSRQDFEWLARDASAEVARARCLPLTGAAGYAQRGWVTVIIVPYSREPRPSPSAELRRRVREHLAARVVAALAPHLRVLGPRYLPVSVDVECVPLRAGQAAEVEERLRDALDGFLHPLTGGARGRGWDFGEAVHLSQIAHVVHGVEGVDHARHIALSVDGRVFDEKVPVDVNSLIAAGEHQLRLLVGVA